MKMIDGSEINGECSERSIWGTPCLSCPLFSPNLYRKQQLCCKPVVVQPTMRRRYALHCSCSVQQKYSERKISLSNAQSTIGRPPARQTLSKQLLLPLCTLPRKPPFLLPVTRHCPIILLRVPIHLSIPITRHTTDGLALSECLPPPTAAAHSTTGP